MSSSQNLSKAEKYAFAFQNSEPCYYSMVPNIIDYLKVERKKKGKVIISGLSVYAKELYRVIRAVASDKGACWYSVESLAKRIGCSVGSIVNAKKELLQPLKQLDGKSLITETVRERKGSKDGNNFKTEYCVYQITGIWGYNNAFFAAGLHKEDFQELGIEEDCFEIPHSPHESGGAPHSPHESAPQGPHSPGEPNKNKKNKNQLLYKEQPAAIADDAYKIPKKMLPSEIRKDLSEKAMKSFEWLITAEFKESDALKYSKIYSIEELKLAAKHMISTATKNGSKKIGNKHGYLIKCLQGRYWETRNNNA